MVALFSWPVLLSYMYKNIYFSTKNRFKCVALPLFTSSYANLKWAIVFDFIKLLKKKTTSKYRNLQKILKIIFIWKRIVDIFLQNETMKSICRLVCAGVVRKPPEDRFSRVETNLIPSNAYSYTYASFQKLLIGNQKYGKTQVKKWPQLGQNFADNPQNRTWPYLTQTKRDKFTNYSQFLSHIFWLRFLFWLRFYAIYFDLLGIQKLQFIQPHKEHHCVWILTTLLWWSILLHTKFLTRLNHLSAFIACTSTWISCWSNKPTM